MIVTCPDCGETFPNPQVYGGHVHAQHPDRRRAMPKFLGSYVDPAERPRRSDGLKRPTDTWPGKP